MKYTQRYVEQGFQFVTLGADSGWMARSAFQDLREIRDTAGANLESTGY
jgi:2-keto-3-deoxy-L-rhamnonate aldolase RhmA